jgi:hypothetical protein
MPRCGVRTAQRAVPTSIEEEQLPKIHLRGDAANLLSVGKSRLCPARMRRENFLPIFDFTWQTQF